MVLVYKLETVIESLVVTVNSVNILKKAVQNRQRSWNLIVYQERTTEVNTDLHQVICGEVIASELTHVVTTEGGLHGVDGWMLLQFIEESHTCSGIFRLLISKTAIIIDEEGADVRQDEGEKARVLWLTRHVTSVHEDVLPSAMAMHVTEEG